MELAQLEEFCAAFHGDKGRFAYRAFTWANDNIFDSRLPAPMIHFALTPYGRCAGMTAIEQRLGHPVITLHPSTWSGRGWVGTAPGQGNVLDIMIHELLHVLIMHVIREGALGRSSHDNIRWARCVEDLSPRVPGIGSIAASPRISRREGKHVRKRVPDGHITLQQLAGWPGTLRPEGSSAYWAQAGLPFDV